MKDVIFYRVSVITKFFVGNCNVFWFLFLLFWFFCFLINTAHSQSVRIEEDASISETRDFSRQRLLSLVEPGAGMIRAMGWRCDSLSAIRPHIFSRGFTMICNNFKYEYEFNDRGGRWAVNLK